MSIKRYKILDLLLLSISMILVEIGLTKYILNRFVVETKFDINNLVISFSLSLFIYILSLYRWKKQYYLIIPMTISMLIIMGFNMQNIVIIILGNIGVLLFSILFKKELYNNVYLYTFILYLGMILFRSIGSLFFINNFLNSIVYYFIYELFSFFLSLLFLKFSKDFNLLVDKENELLERMEKNEANS